jgi:RNA polymerase sigma factor (sigma-70 family)
MPASVDSETSIGELYVLHQASILRLAYAYVKNRHDAEDMAQEVFLAFLANSPRFSNDAQVRAWLIKVTCNKCRDFLKSFWHRRTVTLPEDLGYLPKTASNLIHQICALEEKYRLPLHLFYYEGYSIQEIAGLLGCSPSTVGTRLDRGRKQLRAALGDDYDE